MDNGEHLDIGKSDNSWKLNSATYVALLAVMFGYPMFRMAVAYTDIFPIFGETGNWWTLWGGIFIGHWVLVAIVLGVVGLERGGLASIGFNASWMAKRAKGLAIVLVVFGIAAVLMPSIYYGDDVPSTMGSHPLGPVTVGQRLFWIVMAVTAGFAEEVAYRGYAITRLRRITNLPIAIVLSIAAFAFMHGPSVFIPELASLYVISGLAFSVAFILLKSRRLELLILVHAFLDLVLVTLP